MGESWGEGVREKIEECQSSDLKLYTVSTLSSIIDKQRVP